MDAKLEQKARELLAEVERGPISDYGTVHRRVAHEAISRALQAQPAEAQAGGAVARKPDGYAYRYPSTTGEGTVIRFTCGQDINGSRAIEAIPYFYGTPPAKVPEGWRRAGTVRITPEGYVHLSADVEQLSAARDAGHGAAVYVAAAQPLDTKESNRG